MKARAGLFLLGLLAVSVVFFSSPATGAREVGCVVPTLRGLSVQTARGVLAAHHCPVSALRVRKVCAPLRQFGIIITQAPARGTKLAKGQLIAVTAGMRCGNPTPPPVGPGGIAAFDGAYEVTLTFNVSVKYGAQNQPNEKTERFNVANGVIAGTDFNGNIDPATRTSKGQTDFGYGAVGLVCNYEVAFTPSNAAVTVAGTFDCNSPNVTVTDGKITGNRVTP